MSWWRRVFHRSTDKSESRSASGSIRDTLAVTKAATFAVHLPNPKQADFPTPRGTGFFVSPDGWFLTAAHVITEDGQADGKVRGDVGHMSLLKELRSAGPGSFEGSEVCTAVALDHVDPIADVAYLRVAESQLQEREWLTALGRFPSLTISSRVLDEGEEVYSFGYPLSKGGLIYPGPEIFVGEITLSPRVTSAIVASLIDQAGMITEAGPPIRYVLDKALNYGNSGGPIVATETGQVHALCSSFQPVYVPQLHLASDPSEVPVVMIPSLYGKVLNLSHSRVLKELDKRSIAYA